MGDATTASMDQISVTQRRLLGLFAFFVSLFPALAITAAIIAALFGLHSNLIFGFCFLMFIIAAGLQLPAFFMVAAAAGNRVPEFEKSLFRQPFRRPFGIFLLWWRYVRKPASPN